MNLQNVITVDNKIQVLKAPPKKSNKILPMDFFLLLHEILYSKKIEEGIYFGELNAS